ncbi:HAMP domain-containing sensor histidine kinase [Actinocorallia aurea]
MRLTAGLVVLLALSWLVVGLVTRAQLKDFLVGRIDQQLAAAGGRFPATLEHSETPPGRDDRADTRGQADGTFGARFDSGRLTDQAVVRGSTVDRVALTDADTAALAALRPGRSRSLVLSGLGEYRVSAVEGEDGDVLITGLPLEQAEEVGHRLLVVEAALFAVVLAVAGAAAAGWVRLALRPLRRVAAVASDVADLPLSDGEVALPAGVSDGDPKTEVGRLGWAFNRMLGHVQASLARRQASEERLRRFAADASHELRTPVAVVRGHAELALRNAGLSPEVAHTLRRIQAESVRMGDLVEDLLLLARLDAGRPLLREPVDLTRLMLDAAADARAIGPDHRWRLDLPEEPVTVTGDRHRLHQALGNLVANARHHTPPGTTVTLRLTPGADTVLLEVHDDGPGIPADRRAGLFDRFVRADPGRSRADGGSGLGLAIVKAVAEAHGGAATMASAPGDTAFRIALPVG